ncbi:SagB family peptide dehydrogenase [Actinomadura sp. NPDC000929]|uniref:SagB family peptide dehydrogenase n=1 Tax=Actinomadura sp. NPDC000929 TaxID=3154517 RepID=UPI003393DD96
MPDVTASLEELLGMRRGVYSATSPSGELFLLSAGQAQSLGRPSSVQRALLRELAGPPRTLKELLAAARAPDSDNDTPRLIHRLREAGWLTITAVTEGRHTHTVEPLVPPPPPPQPPAETEEGWPVLSRFAAVLRRDDGLVLQSPRAWCDVSLHDPAAVGLLGYLAGTGTHQPPGNLPHPATTARLLYDLRWAGLTVRSAGEEDGEARTRQWSPHELWFHERSRVGSRAALGEGFGATLWAHDRFPPVPARHRPYPSRVVDLPRPDLGALRATDPTLTTVLEDRRSIRVHVDAPALSTAQLGEFLYRCARTKKVVSYGGGVESAARPYPSGGGVHELEVYPVVRRMADLDPGMYHYDSHAHELRLVREHTHPAVLRLLRTAATAHRGPLQVLLVIAARSGRVMLRYEAMAYALTLKHVGVLYQTMYCVATAMGLAPCALGAGDAPAFAHATGRDALEECGVGEFALACTPATHQKGEQ